MWCPHVAAGKMLTACDRRGEQDVVKSAVRNLELGWLPAPDPPAPNPLSLSSPCWGGSTRMYQPRWAHGQPKGPNRTEAGPVGAPHVVNFLYSDIYTLYIERVTRGG